MSTPGGPAAGMCWSKDEVPPSALVGTHDFTPTNPRDPACRVTDWLPPVLVPTFDPDAAQMFFDKNGALWFLSVTKGALRSQIVKP